MTFAPVHDLDRDAFFPDEQSAPARGPEGIALCLSGGGFRAMVFHLGALLRLNEAGLLPRLARISSVSGGSITVGALAAQWEGLDFDPQGRARNIDTLVATIRRIGSLRIDVNAVLRGIGRPGASAEGVGRTLDAELFRGQRLNQLPRPPDAPRFVFNATNLQTGTLWRFTHDYMGSYDVGLVRDPDLPLGTAVAASLAFPPFLSPLRLPDPLRFDPSTFGAREREFRQRVQLTDGGIYDNLGLETAFKRHRTLLVSNGGQRSAPVPRPPANWIGHVLRVLNIVDGQVRALRARQLIAAFEMARTAGTEPLPSLARTGAYWGIDTSTRNYPLPSDPLGTAGRDPRPLAAIPTRLAPLAPEVQDRLMNWGYAVTDAALRSFFREDAEAMGLPLADPQGFPCPGGY